MNFSVPKDKKEKTALVPAAVFRTEEGRALKERYDNVMSLVDPADKLLMLDALEKEVLRFEDSESRYRHNIFAEMEALSVTGASALSMGAAGLLMGPMGVLMLFPGIFVGLGASFILSNRSERLYDAQFSDIAFAQEAGKEISRVKTEMLENLDVKEIARLPSGVKAFAKFPQLKERFMLAIAVDKMIESEDAVRLQSLDKQKPAQDNIRL